MSSAFEEFIRQNKEQFDSETPATEVWAKIEKNIAPKVEVFTLKEVYKWSAVAAIFCVAVTSIYFLFFRNPDVAGPVARGRDNEKALQDKVRDISTFAPEYAGEVQQIFKAIEVGQSELELKSKEEPDLYRQFAADLKMLDSSYHELKTQAQFSSNRDIIIVAMLGNLRLQAELLRRQLMIMNSLKNTKPDNNEKGSSESL